MKITSSIVETWPGESRQYAFHLWCRSYGKAPGMEDYTPLFIDHIFERRIVRYWRYIANAHRHLIAWLRRRLVRQTVLCRIPWWML